MKVNFLDLKRQYISIKDEVDDAIQKVLLSSAFTSGPYVKEFEQNFAAIHHAKYCIAVNSGTAALHATLMVLNIQSGDEVIVPANTFFATPEAVSLCGATPVFLDCDPMDYNIDVHKIESAINKNTKAIIPVHLYGQPARMDDILSVAKKHNLMVIEDCAQAHLAQYKDHFVGTLGLCGCFSFYPGKNLGAYGEGGAILTNDEMLFQNLLKFRNHGTSQKYHHEFTGHNYRMTGIQGAILNVKLKYLNTWTDQRRKNASLYRQLLSDCHGIVLPNENANSKHVYHLFVIRTKQRDALMKYLREHKIITGLHYPIPCHLQKAYQFLSKQQKICPVSERYAKEILSLPMSEQLQIKEIEYVIETIKEFYRG
ncbi:DegT/DnrJ/EryC1/StrS family aminotransferase [bacterium]|nr:DegT/DnrJ/EryC1/StrS family aminotransferase [bacterium]